MSSSGLLCLLVFSSSNALFPRPVELSIGSPLTIAVISIDAPPMIKEIRTFDFASLRLLREQHVVLALQQVHLIRHQF